MPSEADPESNYELSEYELQRLKRIGRNNARLVQLGLNDKYGGKIEFIRKKKKVVRRQRAPPKIKPGEERRSKRLSRDKVKLYELSNDHDDRAIAIKEQQDTDCLFVEDSDHGKKYQAEVRQVKRRYTINDGDCSLSKEDMEALQKGEMDKEYLGKFQEFLRYIGKISEQNERSVMRQVGKLARGEGIRYESPRYGWKQDQYFMKGRKITPLDDIVDLMEKAQDCEDEWGRDHGNGWLLAHPLKKLLLFQQFCLHNPSFLTSKCKIKEYVRREEEGEEDEEEEEMMADEQPMNGEVLSDDEVPTVPTNQQDEPKHAPSKPAPASDKKKKNKKKDKKKNKNEVNTKPTSKSTANEHVGSRIAKDFVDGIYFGTITKYLSDVNFWSVKYDDSDKEEFDTIDLRKALRHYQKQEDPKKSKSKHQAKGKRSTAVATPPAKRRKTRDSSAGTRTSPRSVVGI